MQRLDCSNAPLRMQLCRVQVSFAERAIGGGIPVTRSRVRTSAGASPTGLAESSSHTLRTGRSSQVAVHLSSWKRSYHFRLQASNVRPGRTSTLLIKRLHRRTASRPGRGSARTGRARLLTCPAVLPGCSIHRVFCEIWFLVCPSSRRLHVPRFWCKIRRRKYDDYFRWRYSLPDVLWKLGKMQRLRQSRLGLGMS
jgi:hypothetical protein